MNKKQVKDRIKELGLRARWNPEVGEWCVHRPGAPESEYYYTPDAQDAIETAEAMSSHYEDSSRRSIRPNMAPRVDRYAVALLSDWNAALEVAVSDGNVEWVESLEKQAKRHAEDLRERGADRGASLALDGAELANYYSDMLEAQHTAHDSLNDQEIALANKIAESRERKLNVMQPRFNERLLEL